MVMDTRPAHDRLILVDNDEEVLQSLQALLESHGIQPFAFRSGLEALASIHADDVGTVITDLDMPQFTGIDLINALIERKSAMSIIVLSGVADVPITVEVMAKGAVTLIQKPFNTQSLIDAIRKGGQLSRMRKQRQDRINEARARIARLTPDELQIMLEASKGTPYKAISHDAGVSTRTVDRRIQSSTSKLGVQSLAEFAILYALATQDLISAT